jgi:NhaP-type Na+/H+ or K+/H+ antiporter
LAEVCGLSGIVSIFFSGMSAKRYIVPNISEGTATSASSIFQLSSYLAETCIFLDLGLSVFGLKGNFQWSFICFTFVATLIGRALAIYPIAQLYNWSIREIPKLPKSDAPSVNSNDGLFTWDGSSVASTLVHTLSARRRTPSRRRDRKISAGMAHILWFAGLRGAVAYACVREFPDVYGNRDVFIATTVSTMLVCLVRSLTSFVYYSFRWWLS